MALCASKRMPSEEARSAILAILANIPAGKVASYGMVAEFAGLKGHARYVGYILKNLPEGSKIPWHRVINASGHCAFPPDSPQYKTQIEKLTAENILVLGGRVELKHHLWKPKG